MKRTCLNLGCGSKLISCSDSEVWYNVDFVVPPSLDVSGLMLTKEGDIRQIARFFPHGTFDHVLCEFVLEHLEYPDVVDLMYQVYLLTKPGASVTIIVPDFHAILDEFAESTEVSKMYSLEMLTNICTKVFCRERETAHRSVWTPVFASRFLTQSGLFSLGRMHTDHGFDHPITVVLKRNA